MKFLATQPDQGSFYPFHQSRANPLPAVFGINTQVINPALLVFTPGHDRADDLSLLEGNQKKLRLDLSPGPEVSDGVIVRRCIGEYFVPKFEYALLVFLAKGPDGYVQDTCQGRELTCR